MNAESPQAQPRSRRDWRIDLTCVVLAVLFGAGAYPSSADFDTTALPLLVLDLVAGVASCLALWWRRRWPVEIGVAVAVASGFSHFSTGASLIMVFTVAVHRQARAAALVAVLNVVAACLLIVVRPDPAMSAAGQAVFDALVAMAVVAWGMYLRARRQLVSTLRDRAERAETEQELRVDQARQRERTRIAREMHDVLGHRISLISMHAGALEVRAQSAGAEILESASVIRASAHQALQDLREVIGVLRTETEDPPTERPQPTLRDLPALVKESQAAGMNIDFDFGVTEEETEIPASVGRTAYRIVQEGLTNARKHAPGAAVRIQVDGAPGSGLTVEVRSRRPIEAPAVSASGSTQGLLGLAERVTIVRGRLEHGRASDGDFLLQSWLPWSAWRVPEIESQDV